MANISTNKKIKQLDVKLREMGFVSGSVFLNNVVAEIEETREDYGFLKWLNGNGSTIELRNVLDNFRQHSKRLGNTKIDHFNNIHEIDAAGVYVR